MSDNNRIMERDQCQLMANVAIGRETLLLMARRHARNWSRKIRGWVAVRTRLRGLLRAIGRHARTEPTATPGETHGANAERNSRNFACGDLVRVRSAAEIAQTLDRHGACHGCAFLKPMLAHCQHEYRIAKIVEHFFDERRWRMLRCHGVVLLEGVHCDGSGLPDTRGCDRMCYFFWRTEWLEPVSRVALGTRVSATAAAGRDVDFVQLETER